ncbi:MAG: hypothetical protein K9K76_02315 [Halanaerobiales bacterium]|nr:hypothetical protein [Halanaerobiales bacterium]
MRKGDITWLLLLFSIILFLAIPNTRELFKMATSSYPYLMGFIKFAILATMGEFLTLRIVDKKWEVPVGVYYRIIIWGILGVVIVLVFDLFNSGVERLLIKDMLPGSSTGFALAFFTSFLMNMIFAPTMMAFHSITDTYIDLKFEENKQEVNLKKVVEEVSWSHFVSFVVLKTIPLFWIPAHTIVFLLPEEYRIITAAFLSMALGAILAFASKKGRIS